jgi:hypothetical protein
MIQPKKRLCQTCQKRRSWSVYPKGARSCNICKDTKRIAIKKEKITESQLDSLLRKYCRLVWGDTPTCIVCGLTSGYSNPQTNPHGIQIGHYVTRTKRILRYDMLNVFPQCAKDNYNHENDTLPMTMAILEKYGKERLEYFQAKELEYEQAGKWFTDEKKKEIKFLLEEGIKAFEN